MDAKVQVVTRRMILHPDDVGAANTLVGLDKGARNETTRVFFIDPCQYPVHVGETILIITDITMSELDGVEAMKIIKKKQSDIKFLICSARADMLEEAMSLGADVFLQMYSEKKLFWEKNK